jgi:hypothetical protein
MYRMCKQKQRYETRDSFHIKIYNTQANTQHIVLNKCVVPRIVYVCTYFSEFISKISSTRFTIDLWLSKQLATGSISSCTCFGY